jgi:hypothetical protein
MPAFIPQQGNPLDLNRIGFALRRWLTWTVRTYHERAEPKAGLFAANPVALAQEVQLNSRYDLTTAHRDATRLRYRETLGYLHWLDTFHALAPDWFASCFSNAQLSEKPVKQAQDDGLPPSLSWLDVGAKNWSYVAALAAFLQANGLQCYALDGVELDPYRRYADFHTRSQYAEAHIRPIPQAQYHAGDIHDWRQPAHIISSFLPFVFPEPHRAWGLPMQHFQPEAQLRHLLLLLQPGGLLLIVNQGEVEAEAQAELLARVAPDFALEWRATGQLPAPFIEYRYPRYGWIGRKRSDTPDGHKHEPHFGK